MAMTVNPIELYGHAVKGVPFDLLRKASFGETATILGPIEVESRQIYFLDLSTGAPTGTFKDWLTCVAIADALQCGVTEIAAQTSGNTGNALAYYTARHGIRLTVFYPAASRYKIDPRFAAASTCRFVELEGSEPAQKELLTRYATALDLPTYPSLSHQIEANKLRAYHLRDWQETTGVRIDWHAQALSSAYGVFGFYRGITELGLRGPAFLGAQQVGMAPYADHLEGREALLDPSKIFEPTLFRSNPGNELMGMLADICWRHGGSVRRISQESYHQRLPELCEIFHRVGLTPKVSVVKSKEMSEKASLLSLLVVLEAIADGQIKQGQNVLVAATGGLGSIPQTEFVPHHRLCGTKSNTVSMYALRERLWG